LKETELKLKIWEPDFTSEESYTKARFQDISQVRNVKLTLPTSLRGEFPQVKLVVESDHPPTDYFTCGPMHVVSARLMDALTSQRGVQAEFFPIEIEQAGRAYTATIYYCLHVLDRADCFDFEQSKYSVDEDGSVDEIERLVLDESETLGHELFRVAHIDFPILCASEQLAHRVAVDGFTGMRFFEPSELKW
jgi:hypothetical protein